MYVCMYACIWQTVKEIISNQNTSFVFFFTQIAHKMTINGNQSYIYSRGNFTFVFCFFSESALYNLKSIKCNFYNKHQFNKSPANYIPWEGMRVMMTRGWVRE